MQPNNPPTEFTPQEAQKMYEILCDIHQVLKERAGQKGPEHMPMYQLAWLMSTEELLGRIKLRQLNGRGEG